MANSWLTGSTITLDTAASDTAYDKSHDALSGGSQYSTGAMCIQAVDIIGATAGDIFRLCASNPKTVKGNKVIEIEVVEGVSNYRVFPRGVKVKGLYPELIPHGRMIVYTY